MNDKHRDILRRHRSWLRRDLEPLKLLPYLVDILDVTDEQEVRARATREEMSDHLLEILPRRGPKAFDEFVKALQGVQPFLASPLIQEAETKSQTMNEEFAVLIEEETKRKDASQSLRKYDTAEESKAKPLSSSLQHEKSLQKSKSKLLSSLLDCESSLNEVCAVLDTSPPRCGTYRAVAQHYGFRHHEIESVLRPHDGGPSRALIESLAATHPELTVQEFAVVIEEKTKRKDASRLLKKYDAAQE